MPNFDFHCHSTASDGNLPPAEVVARARERGVEALALTDHDTTAGVAEASAAAGRHGLRLVPAIELSARCQKHPVHVVGLGVDPNDPALQEHVERLGRLRRERARAMGDKLRQLGLEDVYERALTAAGAAEPTRTHFAQALVESGRAPSMGAAFKRYLGRGKSAYVSVEWPELSETVALIRGSGGVAVLAHPHGYGWTGAWTRRILEAFVDAAGQGLEVVCGSSSPSNIRDMSGHARRFGLYASQGSDFHSPSTPWIELGRLAAMPEDLRPVWEAPEVARFL